MAVNMFDYVKVVRTGGDCHISDHDSRGEDHDVR